MITDDEVMRLFERADPARGGDDAVSFLETAAHLRVVRPGYIEEQPTEIVAAPTPTTHHWRRIVGAAAAVVLIAAGAVVAVTHDDATPELQVAARAGARAQGPSAEQAEQLARAFLDAYGAFDAERALTLLNKHAVAAVWGSPAKFRRELELLQATGYQQTILDPSTILDPLPMSVPADGCDAYHFDGDKTLSRDRLIVKCAYVYHGLRSDAIGRRPYGAYWAILVDNGRIVSAENRVGNDLGGFDDQTWRPFRHWVSSAYPQDAAAMYRGATGSEWKRTEQSVRLWDQHTREYVAIGAPYVARADAICTAAHDRFEAAAGPPPTGPFDANVEAYHAYDAIAARVLEEALAELRTVPPPDAFRAEWERAYALGDQLVRGLRRPGTGGGQDGLHVFGGQPGLKECRMLILGG